jgi:hypothetical protein
MYPYPDPVLSPIQAKPKKLQLQRAPDHAFLPVHFQFQFPFKILRTPFHHPLSGPAALDVDVAIIHIPDKRGL